MSSKPGNKSRKYVLLIVFVATIGICVLVFTISVLDFAASRASEKDINPSNEEVIPSNEEIGPSKEEVSPPKEEVSPSREEVGPANPGTKIYINGLELTPDEVIYLETLLGSTIPPGRYWLDENGNFGQEGYPAIVNVYQLLYPTVPEPGVPGVSPSNPDTNIYVNGLELTPDEVFYLETLLGSTIPPGRYWLDENGNFGYEGYPPLVNIYQLMYPAAPEPGMQKSESTDLSFGDGCFFDPETGSSYCPDGGGVISP